MEQLQASNAEKDDLIVNFKNNISNLESDSLTKTKLISRLSRELELYKKSRSGPVTPEFRRCTAEGWRQLGGKSIVHNRNATVKKDHSSSQVAEKGSKNSKRKTFQRSSISEPPKLISSSFKVPKLKNSSPSFT